MMTPQEAASCTFPKATLGGYSMAAVDVFLDKLTEDYTTLYKENAALKAKIKVLVDKMEEYHAMEDTMRSTLLTAQKMANTMVAEAEEKTSAMIADGEAAAKRRMKELADDVAAEERRLEAVHREIDEKIAQENERLAAARRELSAFIGAAEKLCRRQMELIERLPELSVLPEGFTPCPVSEGEKSVPVEQEAAAEPSVETVAEPSVEAAAEPVDDGLAAAALAEVVEELGGDANSLVENMRNVIDSFSHENEQPSAPEEKEQPFDIGFEDADSLFETEADKEKTTPENGKLSDDEEEDFPEDEDYDDEDYDEDDPFMDEVDEKATRVLNLRDLQFGRNYNKDKK